MEKKTVIRELVKGVDKPSFCSEEGCLMINRLKADMEDDICKDCAINNIVRAFCKGVEWQREQSDTITEDQLSTWVDVAEDLPCHYEQYRVVGNQMTVPVPTIGSDGQLRLSNMVRVIGASKGYFHDRWIWDGVTDEPLFWLRMPKSPI